VGDLEGSYPTSIRFSRYPLREIVLATALAWWGDSVTGVNANYTTRRPLSTPSYKPVIQAMNVDETEVLVVIPEVIHMNITQIIEQLSV